MTKEDFLIQLREYNEDELFYRQYYYAGKQKERLDAFLAELDPFQLSNRGLYVSEISSIQIPTNYSDEDFFTSDSAESVCISKHNRFTPPFRHSHVFFEVTYVLEGSCTQSINGIDVMLSKGDFCLISPDTPHSISVFDSSIIINILIRRSMFEETFTNMIHSNDIFSLYFKQILYTSSYKDYLIFSTGNDVHLQDLILEMFMEFQDKRKYYESILSNMLMILFSKILRNYESTVYTTRDSRHHRPEVLEMITYMEQNYRDITLPDLAEHFHFSVQYCSKLLKQYTGKTFSKLLQTIRFEKAKLLLKNTNISVAEISNQMGFQNPEYFNRRFKELFHVTPGEYRHHALNT